MTVHFRNAREGKSTSCTRTHTAVASLSKLSVSQESSPSLSDKEWSMIAAHLPRSVMKQLADPKSKAVQWEVRISREAAVRKLRELEYHGLAVALEIGWFL